MCLPTGTPIVGAPDPATNGYSPHSWLVVPWYSMPGPTCTARPAPGERQPHADASPRRLTVVDVIGVLLVVWALNAAVRFGSARAGHRCGDRSGGRRTAGPSWPGRNGGKAR